MPCTVTVLYPGGKTSDGKDAEFNTKYYKESHMPMVLDELKGYGMTGKSLLLQPILPSLASRLLHKIKQGDFG